MALIECPDCKATISDSATKCPQCGVPVHLLRLANEPGYFGKAMWGSLGLSMGILIFGAMIIFVISLGFAVLMLYDGNDPFDSETLTILGLSGVVSALGVWALRRQSAQARASAIQAIPTATIPTATPTQGPSTDPPKVAVASKKPVAKTASRDYFER